MTTHPLTTAARFLVAVLALQLGACERGLETPSDPEVIARYDGGTLSMTELQEALTRLPPERRPSIQDGPVTAEWMLEFARELLVDRLLAEEAAKLDPGEDLLLQSKLNEQERNLAWSELVARQLTPIADSTPAEVERSFERWTREEAQPETRQVRNIFLRSLPGESRSDTRRRARALASRAAAGESFADLARAHSDSESRHQGGSIGSLAAQDLPAPVAEVVFALEEHSASEPLVNSDGAHIFYVERIIPAVGGEFSQVEPLVAQWLREEAEALAIESMVGDLPDPDEAVTVASQPELEAMIANYDTQAIVLRRGSYQLNLSDLMAEESGLSLESLALRLERLAWREKAHSFAVSRGWLDLPHVQRALESARELHIGEQLRLESMRQRVLGDPAAIESYFDNQRARFDSPLSLHLERWRLPFPAGDVKPTMLALESHYREAAPGALELHDIESRFGGTVENLGWMPLEDMSHQAPRALVASLKRGESSPPYRYAQGLEMLRVVDRQDPSPRSLEAVRAEVVEAYLGEHGQRLYREWRDDLLAKASVEVFSDRVSVAD